MSLNELLNEVEFSKSADRLIGMIRTHYLDRHGKVLTNARVQELATGVIKDRLRGNK